MTQPESIDAVTRRRIEVSGVVQGVGFRPFVWRLARRHRLHGWVRNTSGGVVIEVQGFGGDLDAFEASIPAEAPALARVTSVRSRGAPAEAGEDGFRIVESQAVAGAHQPISPDAATCDDCLRELFDPADRRHRYAFINCTNCGPRFTIIEDVPYDRPLTTMRRFAMCPPCRTEYEDPADRRFHAQPNACPDCGPRLWLATAPAEGGAPEEVAGDAVDLAAQALRRGGIVAVKGLGGFQLACDARDQHAVDRLRERKRRPAKPFALMVADLAGARALCDVSAAEEAALTSTARPIVLLRRRADAEVAASVAPGVDELGVMLPGTPLHHLLLRAAGLPLVMTSGNLSEEPIAKDNDEAAARLGAIADTFLLHDRDIYARYDDSVVRVAGGALRTLRRARGYCPEPVEVENTAPGDVLAFGAHLKNTFTILRAGSAFVGPHIGDLDDVLSLDHQGEAMRTYLRLFRAAPATVACDLHPDYASTRLAEAWADHPPVRVQHHHAHVASVMAEHGLRGRLLGVAFDGTGFGPDGTIWGGEFLLCDEASFERAGHLATVRQPGGDLCAREGWRMAAAYLVAAGIPVDPLPAWLREDAADLDARRWRMVCRLAAGDMAPRTSSAGRLFDGVASLLGVAHASTFEAEAAMRLESVAASVPAGAVAPLPVEVGRRDGALVVDAPGLVRTVVEERVRGRPQAELAAAFHETLATAIARVCAALGGEHGLRRVALSGGVFQNALLLERTREHLDRGGFEVHTNCAVPANDGGISLGQALVAAARHAGGIEGRA